MKTDHLAYKVYIILAVILLGIIAPVKSQRIEIHADNDSLSIGDQTKIEFQIIHDKNQVVNFLFPKDTLTSELEIVNQTNVDSTFFNDSIKLSKLFTITSFDTGFLVVPPFLFPYNDGNKLDTLKSNPQLLYYSPISVDTTKNIKPIKEIKNVPLSFEEILPWLLAVLVVLIITFIIWYFIRKKRGKQTLFSPKPKPIIPEDIEALKNLDILDKKKLWQQGLFKTYFSELSFIIRHYIERRFNIQAIESTTDEIIRDLKKSQQIDNDLIMRLENDSRLADLAKFAKYEPLSHECENSLKNAVIFVEKTRRETETNKLNIEEKGGKDVG